MRRHTVTVGSAAVLLLGLLGCGKNSSTPASTAESPVDYQSSHGIPVCEAWNRRLQVGVYLRHGRLSNDHRMVSRILQNHLELLEHMAEDEAPCEELAQEIAATSRAFSRLVNAYRDELQ